jgi:hypothetical protein
MNRLAIGVTMLTVFTAIPVMAIESRKSRTDSRPRSTRVEGGARRAAGSVL